MYWTSGQWIGGKVSALSVTSTSNSDTVITIGNAFLSTQDRSVEACYLKSTASTVPGSKDDTLACTGSFTITVSSTCTFVTPTVNDFTITSAQQTDYSFGGLRNDIN